jgi:mono/diheme cytochrome c family protein
MSRGLLALSAVMLAASAADPTSPELARRFESTVRPFVESYCVSCHSGEKPMAQFDLKKYPDLAAVAADYPHWALVLEKLTSKQMPPAGMKQPPEAARRQVIDWILAFRRIEARRNAGDPGLVLARRLNNAEYNYTIRDLTGVDLRPTREFPVDPANPAGFDNSGESLAMSPALMNKYLQAAREVANHLVLKPAGIAFAAHPMLVDTDRDKYCVNQIIDFYQRHNTDYADYFQAAWRYKHRVALGRPRATLSGVAAASRVSPKYLATIWRTLEETSEEAGPIARLQAIWRGLPAPKAGQPSIARAGTERMRDFVIALRKKIEPRVTPIPGSGRGVGGNGQPFLMWRNRQYAANRMKYDPGVLQVEGEWKAPPPPPARIRPPADEFAEDGLPAVAERATGPDPDLRVPAGQRAVYEAAFARFAAIFPDAFYVSERGRYFPDNTRDKGRHLSAGFHNLMGYFRDDGPLYELILDEKQQKELDGLWRELDFIASATHRTYTQFYLYESGEARTPGAAGDTGLASTGEPTPEEHRAITSEPRIRRVEQNYLRRARDAGNERAAKAVEEHFGWVNSTIRWVEKARLESEPVHVAALRKFAARAWRRPLTQAEADDLAAYYRHLRDRDGLAHEEAIRDSIVAILMSPDFCYRIDLAGSAVSSSTRAPLPAYALASRLSYFLWSSMPDEALLARAASDELRRPEVLAAEARRMLKDPRSRGLAVEFGGAWLDFRRFEEHNAVDRERFPTFTNELRQSMFEEPVRFLEDVIRNNRSALDFLYGTHTFVDAALAQHYRMPPVDGWTRIDDARPYGRGGLLPMAAFLTKNAPGLRTSPVKRGYWVVRRVLGEVIPPPPAMVPELPRDEARIDAPLRELLARHREDPSCSSCHARFDSLGLALEGYGPVGERRTHDLAGRPVDARAAFPGANEGEGLDGLRAYIRAHRQNDFIDNLARKLMVYALGRSLVLSDEPFFEALRERLALNRYRFHTLVESIVTSPQFRTKRIQDSGARQNVKAD